MLLCDPFEDVTFRDTNGSILLLAFFTEAVSLQERCRALAEAERWPAAEALAAVPLTSCLPHALHACLCCCPALDVLR